MPRTRLGWLLCLLSGAVGVSLALRVAPYQVDDAAITYRYAANLAAGHGLTFNPGHPAVEGFSSPAWLALLALAASLFSPSILPIVATIAGLACAIALVVILARSSPRLDGDTHHRAPWPGVFALAVWALCPAAAFHAVAGLEPMLFVLIVVVLSRAIADQEASWGVFLAAFAATWVRPEGPWILVAVAVQLAAQGEWRRIVQRPTRDVLAVVVAGALTVVAMRLAIFHALLPNTFFAKRAGIAIGAPYVFRTLASPWAAAMVAAGFLGAMHGTKVHRGYLAAAVAWSLAAAVEGGDWMPAARMMMPALAMFSLAAGGLGIANGEAVVTRPRRGVLVAGIIATVAAASFGAIASTQIAATASLSEDGIRHENDVLASWLRQSGVHSVALVDIGQIGFRAPIEIIDLGGLTDARIAHAPGSLLEKRFDRGYLFDERRPDVIVLRSDVLPARSPHGNLAPRTDQAISVVERYVLADPRMPRDYVPLFVLLPGVTRSPLYARIVFLRRGTRLTEAARLPSDTLFVGPPS